MIIMSDLMRSDLIILLFIYEQSMIILQNIHQTTGRQIAEVLSFAAHLRSGVRLNRVTFHVPMTLQTEPQRLPRTFFFDKSGA